MNYKSLALASLILISLLLSGCQSTNHTNEKVDITIEVYEGVRKIVDEEISLDKGTNGLEATMEAASGVEYQRSAYGVFITSVGGIKADPEHYWALYVNGKYADKAVDKYILNEDTTITWKLEEISEFPLS